MRRNSNKGQVAEELGIKYTTAKTIVRIFKREGRTEKKRRFKNDPETFIKPRKRQAEFAINHEEAQRMVCIMIAAAEDISRQGRQEGLWDYTSVLPEGFWMEKLTKHFAADVEEAVGANVQEGKMRIQNKKSKPCMTYVLYILPTQQTSQQNPHQIKRQQGYIQIILL
eukprot:TRINITY_DN696_c0_g1_i1.p2 TRINITY_DN696_c0_g1~~TRINITY_DN696_c0_g1_i1.p2  ORF type:complete len:168 (+),score=13.75 TRINITY_DN696_c0_g1_i1:568-1071(+)